MYSVFFFFNSSQRSLPLYIVNFSSRGQILRENLNVILIPAFYHWAVSTNTDKTPTPSGPIILAFSLAARLRYQCGLMGKAKALYDVLSLCMDVQMQSTAMFETDRTLRRATSPEGETVQLRIDETTLEKKKKKN